MVLRETKKFKTRDGKPRKFFGCSNYPKCKGTHGAHPDGRPLGVPGDAATKAARGRAHAAFDKLWKQGLMQRKEAYRWLDKALALGKGKAHIGGFDIATCEKVVKLCTERLALGKTLHRPSKPKQHAPRPRMSVRDAMDFVDDDEPDGAYWAQVAEMAGIEYGELASELAGEEGDEEDIPEEELLQIEVEIAEDLATINREIEEEEE